jgi:V/A-type H+-transporting ATPase subunit D
MWLRRRLATAQRGHDQLDRKLHILLPELQRRRLQADQSQRQWSDACQEADTWLLRATLLGGQDALRNATTPQLTQIEVTWTTAMGVSYPADARLADHTAQPSSQPRTLTPLPGNAAIAPATTAFQTALLAAIRTAAAQEAVRRVEIEIAVTRRRLRALDKRWLPSLHEALTHLEMSLEQAEQEDGMRLRRAAAAQPDAAAAQPGGRTPP